jgi:catechol 2,3-dioxygenase
MQQQSTHLTPTSIHPDTGIGLVTLRVANLDRSLSFYEGVLGFRRIELTAGKATLGTQDGTPLLGLQELPGASPQPFRSTGLYHVAILLPSRADLGRILLRLAEAGIEIGQADHLVSEALYLSDPDGNGLEIYRDRPRASWRRENGMVKMATDPLDLYSLVEEGKRDALPWEVLPAGTRIGHIHLRAGDIPQAERFYHTILGFDITARLPSALFLSAGGYHHHIGMNTWQSRGAGPAPETTVGLQTFVIALPNQDALAEVRARLAAHGIPVKEQGDDLIVADPWLNQIRLIVMPPSTNLA